MAQLLILGVGMAILGGMIPVIPDQAQRSVGTVDHLFSKSREDGVQPTRAMQKRMAPVTRHVAGNAYNDAPFSVVTSNRGNHAATPQFKEDYTKMLKENRLRPSQWLVSHIPGQSLHMQGTVGNDHYGWCDGIGAGDQRIPISFRTQYVSARISPAFSPHNRSNPSA